jgi:hypothetical protein
MSHEVNVEGYQDAAFIGRRLKGEAALPVRAGSAVLFPFEDLLRHTMVFGGSGSGKSELMLAISREVARKSGLRQAVLDAKGDRRMAARWVETMRQAGKSVRVFPNEPYDAWRGSWRAIMNRMLEVIRYAEDGPAAYYRDIAKVCLRLACHHPDGPPRSSAEFLARLSYDALEAAHGKATSAIRALPAEKVSQVQMRYHAFFGQMGCRFDGDWSFEDTEAAYFLLDSAALGEEADGVACLLAADEADYITHRKAEDEYHLSFKDEFSAVARASDFAEKAEQARGFNAAWVFISQSPAGMGDSEQRDRMFGAIRHVLAHQMNEPEEIAALAGEKKVMEVTHRLDGGIEPGKGTARQVDRARVSMDEIRRLGVGQAWIFAQGRATKVAVQAAPRLVGELPAEAELDRPAQRLEALPPKEIDFLPEE